MKANVGAGAVTQEGDGTSMDIKQVSVSDARAAMEQDPNTVYLDVRTVREFEQGHPVGALNVPVAFIEPGTPAKPNDEFVALVRRHVPQDAPVLVGCQSGGRSQRAAELLVAAGYVHVS